MLGALLLPFAFVYKRSYFWTASSCLLSAQVAFGLQGVCLLQQYYCLLGINVLLAVMYFLGAKSSLGAMYFSQPVVSRQSIE